MKRINQQWGLLIAAKQKNIQLLGVRIMVFFVETTMQPNLSRYYYVTNNGQHTIIELKITLF